MVDRKIMVTENMADFVDWANKKGRDEIYKMVQERLDDLKEFSQAKPLIKDEYGLKWDPVLEHNDGVDQWKHGGDCNFCRKAEYCMTRCRPSRLLRAVTTPFLYQKYLEENPDALAKAAQTTIKPEDVVEMVQ